MADNLELKACPFCATVPHTEANSAMPGGRVVVADCERGCPLHGNYSEVAAWNTRTPTPPAGDVVERVARAIREEYTRNPAGPQVWNRLATAALAAGSGERWRDIADLPEPRPDMAVYAYMVRTGDRRSWVMYIRPPHDIPSASTHFVLLPPSPALNEQEG